MVNLRIAHLRIGYLVGNPEVGNNNNNKTEICWFRHLRASQDLALESLKSNNNNNKNNIYNGNDNNKNIASQTSASVTGSGFTSTLPGEEDFLWAASTNTSSTALKGNHQDDDDDDDHDDDDGVDDDDDYDNNDDDSHVDHDNN